MALQLFKSAETRSQAIPSESASSTRFPTGAGVGETRVWEDRFGTKVGVCLPELGSLRMGRYITEWGYLGDGEGGRGGLTGTGRAFSGSLVVDDEGFVYVVDEANNRIQKFAP